MKLFGKKRTIVKENNNSHIATCITVFVIILNYYLMYR